jgi:hypothetical protein
MIHYVEWNNNILFFCEHLTDTTVCSINNKDCDYKTCPKIQGGFVNGN